MCTTRSAWLGNRGILHKLGLGVLTFVAMFAFTLSGRATNPPSVTLTPSVSSPQMLGTSVTWTAAVLNAPTGHTYGYQFSVTYNGQAQLLSDFSPTPTFTWVPHTVEGAYTFSVVVRDITTTPAVLFAPVSVGFDLLPYVTAPLGQAVNPTSHPLVALFSGPPCTVGHQLLVRFHPASSTVSMTTNLLPCAATSANWYVAGMYPSTKYLMHWEEYSGTSLVNTGSDLPFTTGALPSTFPTLTFTVNVPPTAHDAAYPVVLFQSLGVASTATDLNGNVLWYGPTGVGMARMESGGLYYAYPSGSSLAEYDLAGNVVMQTNSEILNEQLVAKGYPVITSFNAHEARNLPDGNIVLLGYRYVSSTTAQGGTPTNPVFIIGDELLVVDHNLQLVWAWDAFAHEDVNRAAIDGDVCLPNAGGCPPGNPGNDWLHSNAIQGTVDGNIIMSQRSQDWVIKINYARGKGDGTVIWHLGAGGDFTIANPPSTTCFDPTFPGNPNIFPWFTHQHDAHFDYEDYASGTGYMILTVFDDGNTRHGACAGTQDSRGMVLALDEASRTAYIETQADLGAYSFALGAAQLLTPGDGNTYSSYDSGIINGTPLAQVSEVNLAGQIVYQLQLTESTYRAYRMANLDTTTEFETTPITGIQGQLPPTQPFSYNSGFAQDVDAFQFNGSASLSGSALQLTDGGTHEASSAFYGSPVNVNAFTTDFTFKQTSATADGFTFTIQNTGPNAVGLDGGGLGYQGIGQSVAIKFDLYNNAGEGINSTGFYFEGASPTVPFINLTGTGINLHSGDPVDAHITYDGTTLHLTLTDTVTGAQWAYGYVMNIPKIVGGSTAYIGFTGGTGNNTAVQQILTWSYEPVAVPDEPQGFLTGAGLTTNGSAALVGKAIELTANAPNERGSAFFTSPVNVQSFTTDFDFQLTSAAADGFTFTIQGVGPTALGGGGGGLGYQSIGTESVAVKFDLYNNAGEGVDSTGVYTNGVAPTVPSIDLTGTGINLHSGDMMHANLNYDGFALTLTLTDLVTHATWSYPFTIDIPSNVGGNTAYVGFTAGTGSSTAVQEILNWTFE